MADAKRYNVDTARDDLDNLVEVLQQIETRRGHVRIVGITWQPSRAVGGAGYTIISETDV